jgi:hypothetical protein
MQDPITGTYLLNNDGMLPVPWLVVFEANSLPIPPHDIVPPLVSGDPDERVLQSGFAAPATLQFRVSTAIGPLLPPGTAFVPALNDFSPTSYPGPNIQHTGLVPSAPDICPVYEISDRVENSDGTYQIIVKNNGFYPWVDNPSNPTLWPVWVIPPAFEEFEDPPTNSRPAFPDRSPIVAVARRYVRLREVP